MGTDAKSYSTPKQHRTITMRPTLIRSMRPTLMRAAAAAKSGEGNVLNQGAKRDPELYILLAVMSGAFGLAGFYFGRKPTSATSEAKVSIAPGSMPWQGDATEGDKARGDYKYQYHPGGDPKNPPKDAPSALHSVIAKCQLAKGAAREVQQVGQGWLLGKTDWVVTSSLER